MDEYTILRYTGTRLGSQRYPAPNFPKIAFGQNPTHFQQLVTVTAATFLKEQYGKELLEIPLAMSRQPMSLDTLIVSSALLSDDSKRRLVTGYQTLGEVIADQDNIYVIFGEHEAPALLNAIRDHFGLPLLPVPALPMAEDMPEELPVEDLPKKRKK